MFDTANKLFLAGLGALSMTRQRAEEIFEEYVRRGEAEHAERSGFVKDLMEAADKAREDMEELVNKQVHQVLTSMDVVTKDDLSRVEAKVDQLLARDAAAEG